MPDGEGLPGGACTPLLHLRLLHPPTLVRVSLQQVLALCSECLEKQQHLLAETHLLHLRVLSAAVEVLSYLRCFPEAAAYARRLLQGYR